MTVDAIPAVERQVAAQAVDHMFQQMPTVWLGNMMMAMLLAVAMLPSVDHLLLLSWFFAVFISLGYRYYLATLYLRPGARQRATRYWGAVLTRSSLYQGFLWGFAGMLFWSESSTLNQVLLYCTILGISISSITINSYWLGTFFAFTIPATGLLALRIFAGGGLENSILGGTLIIYNLVVGLFALATNRTLLDSIRLRFEKQELVEELSRANQLKSRFLAAASHDLRQPVHSLVLLIEALTGEVKSARGRELLGHIDNAVNAHNQLLNSLLDLSRLDAGLVEPKVEAFHLQPLIDSLTAELAPLAEHAGLDLRSRPCALRVHSDQVLLGNILRNLMGNAIRYTRTGGVLVGCRRRGDRLLLQVWDTGVGIPEQERESVFIEFHQLHNPERDRGKDRGPRRRACRKPGT